MNEIADEIIKIHEASNQAMFTKESLLKTLSQDSTLNHVIVKDKKIIGYILSAVTPSGELKIYSRGIHKDHLGGNVEERLNEIVAERALLLRLRYSVDAYYHQQLSTAPEKAITGAQRQAWQDKIKELNGKRTDGTAIEMIDPKDTVRLNEIADEILKLNETLNKTTVTKENLLKFLSQDTTLNHVIVKDKKVIGYVFAAVTPNGDLKIRGGGIPKKIIKALRWKRGSMRSLLNVPYYWA